MSTTNGYPRSEVAYLHLKPGRYSRDLTIVKMAKSQDAAVEPGVVIVKAKVTVPAGFFDEAMPYVEIEFKPGDEIQPEVTIGVKVND
jgi:hypothetical protein